MTEKCKSAMQILAEIRNGRMIEDFTERLGDLVEACEETGKVGTITLTIKIKPEAGLSGTVATVIDQIKASIPQPAVPPTPFYVQGRTLLREDPGQHKLGLKSADKQQEVSNG